MTEVCYCPGCGGSVPAGMADEACPRCRAGRDLAACTAAYESPDGAAELEDTPGARRRPSWRVGSRTWSSAG